MKQFSLTDLAKIIERESKDSTYKFALLRGTIDIIKNFPNLKVLKSDLRVHYPMGLMVLKWIEYYFPLYSDKNIPQRHGKQPLGFKTQLEDVINLYEKADKKYFSFYSDLRKGVEDPEKAALIIKLLKKVRQTIKVNPMTYIGSSIDQQGNLYKCRKITGRNPEILDLNWIYYDMGTFSVPESFYSRLDAIGSFISGTNSIIFKWAEFTSGLSAEANINSSEVIELLCVQENLRDVEKSKHFFKDILEQEKIKCVWSGKNLSDQKMHIDHILPFSVIQNNDLWNLLPTNELLNIKKSDNIPPPDLLKKRDIKDRIIYYWKLIATKYEDQFFREIDISLIGMQNLDRSNWENCSYNGLIDLSNHLIENRGLNPWKYIVK